MAISDLIVNININTNELVEAFRALRIATTFASEGLNYMGIAMKHDLAYELLLQEKVDCNKAKKIIKLPKYRLIRDD